MARFDKAILAEKYGITGVNEVLYNPTYEVLFNEEMKPELEGFDKGQETELGAINVMTGVYTGHAQHGAQLALATLGDGLAVHEFTRHDRSVRQGETRVTGVVFVEFLFPVSIEVDGVQQIHRGIGIYLVEYAGNHPVGVL